MFSPRMVPKIAEQQKPVQRECQEAGLRTSVSVEVEVHVCYILLSHACLVQSMGKTLCGGAEGER